MGEKKVRAALIVLTNGREDYLDRTLGSAFEAIDGELKPRIMVDDSQNSFYGREVDEKWSGQFDVIHHAPKSLGFCGAIQKAWDLVKDFEDVQYVFHLEEDFVFNHYVNLAKMISILDNYSHVAQVALLRQPWNDSERAAGGIVQQHPDSYEDCSDGQGNEWLEHRLFFTTNPSVYRRSLIDRGWPQVPYSEGIFTHQLIEDPDLRFAFYGPRNVGPAVLHIGDKRTGTKY